MGQTQRSICIHQHAGTVAVSTDDTPTVYLTGADARALARELIRFADSVGGKAHSRHTYPVQRIISDGTATNAGDGQRRCKYLGA